MVDWTPRLLTRPTPEEGASMMGALVARTTRVVDIIVVELVEIHPEVMEARDQGPV